MTNQLNIFKYKRKVSPSKPISPGAVFLPRMQCKYLKPQIDSSIQTDYEN